MQAHLFINYTFSRMESRLKDEKEANYMKCPSCTETVLSMSERNGIEIDFCPSCRGVWLDRGELDKIISKAVSEQESLMKAESKPAETNSSQQPSYSNNDFRQHDMYRKNYYGHKRKKSFLEDLFD